METVLEMAKIFKKESSRPLTNYQKQINYEAGMLALDNPALLARRGNLLELAREKVVDSGYTFVKGKSRSNKLGVPDVSTRQTRTKVSAELRHKRIGALEEGIANFDEQLRFKEKRRQQAETVRNYKLCDELTEEIGIVKQQRREMADELALFRTKDRKSKWYKKRKEARKSSDSTSNITSDDSDYPVSSPNSSVASTRSEILLSDSEELHGSSTDIELVEESCESVFCPGLPVQDQ